MDLIMGDDSKPPGCAAMYRAGRAALDTLYGLALKFDCPVFVEHFAMDLIMGADSKPLGCVAIGNEMASYYNEAVKSLEEWKSLVSFA